MKELEFSADHAQKFATVANDILQAAQQRGASQAEVGILANKGFSVSVHGGDVETIEYNQDKAIEVVVYFGKRKGSASLSDLRPEAIYAAVDAACHIAKFTDEDPAAGIADKEELAFNYPQLKTAFPWEISVDGAIKLALECEEAALAQDQRIMSAEEVSVGTGEVLHLYANSNGFLGFFPYTRHEINCILVAKDENEMQRDYSYTTSVDPYCLESPINVGKHAALRTVKRLGSRRLSTMKVPVIFIAEEARGLLGHLTSAIQGGHIYRKSSFLLNKLNKQIFPNFIHIAEQPHLELGLGSAPFDEEGVATRPNVFIEDGILRSYSLGIYSARKLNMKSTGNAGGVHNLTIRTGNRDLPALLKLMDRGILVTELMGQGVNLITGDYSRGASGYWIENGEIQYPIHEITIAGNLQEMFAQVSEVGNDVDVRGNIRTGSILIAQMTVAGK